MDQNCSQCCTSDLARHGSKVQANFIHNVDTHIDIQVQTIHDNEGINIEFKARSTLHAHPNSAQKPSDSTHKNVQDEIQETVIATNFNR